MAFIIVCCLFPGYYFNPEYMYRGHEQVPNEADIRAGVQRVIIRLEPNIETQITAMNQLFLYRQGQDTFGTPLAQRAAKNTMPGGYILNHNRTYIAYKGLQKRNLFF